MSQDWSEIVSDDDYPEYVKPHTFIVNGVQEVTVRRYIYNSIDKTDTSGCITYRDALIRYEGTPKGTALHSDDKEKLIAFVCACLSGRSPIIDIVTYNVLAFQSKSWICSSTISRCSSVTASPRRC